MERAPELLPPRATLPSRRTLAPERLGGGARAPPCAAFPFSPTICSDKEEAMPSIGQENLETVMIDFFRWGLEERREIDALEFTRRDEQVVMGARGLSITEVGGEPLEGQIFNVFTLRDGWIVCIEDYRRRTEAFSAAGIPADAGWH